MTENSKKIMSEISKANIGSANRKSFGRVGKLKKEKQKMDNFTGIDSNGIVRIDGHAINAFQQWNKGNLSLPKEAIMVHYRKELILLMLFDTETYGQYVIEDLQEFELQQIAVEHAL